MSKIILVANNFNQPAVDFRNQSQITSQDIIVRIGKAFMVAGDRTDMFFIRGQKNGYTGVDQHWRIKNDILRSSAKYYAINASPILSEIIKSNRNIDRSFHFTEIISSVECSKKYKLNCPSSGLVVLEFLLKKFPKPHQVYINNFSWEGWQGHDWEKEKNIFEEYLKQKKILIYKQQNLLKHQTLPKQQERIIGKSAEIAVIQKTKLKSLKPIKSLKKSSVMINGQDITKCGNDTRKYRTPNGVIRRKSNRTPT